METNEINLKNKNLINDKKYVNIISLAFLTKKNKE